MGERVNMNLKQSLQLAARLSVAAVLLYAAGAKALPSKQGEPPVTVFSEWSQLAIIRWALICGEAGLAIWLTSGIGPPSASVTALIIFSAFSGLLILDLGRDRPKACGCMGAQFVAEEPD